MRHRITRFSFWAAAALGAACGGGGDPAQPETSSVQQSALTTEESVLGLENATQWSTSSGTLSTSTTKSQGAASVAISSGISYAELTSAPLARLSTASSTLSFDLRLSSTPAWGWASITLNAPTAGIYSAYLGQVSLANQASGSFKTVSFNVNSDLIRRLLSFDYTDLTLKLVVNVPATTGLTYLDNLRFSGPTTVAPAYVLGHQDLTTVVPNEVIANRTFNPQGVIVDRSGTPDRLYVWDSGNMRILGYDALGTCAGGTTPGALCTYDGECSGSGATCAITGNRQPKFIFGQKDESSAACNGDSTQVKPASASTLCPQPYPRAISLAESPEPAAMAIDPSGNLYVPDKWNHRILKYNSPFTTNNVVADYVWGQPDFEKRECNQGRGVNSPTASTLCLNPEITGIHISGDHGGTGVDVDTNGNVWVTDTGNNRVLRFPPSSKTADVVLGQADFNVKATNPAECVVGAVSTGRRLCSPKVVRYNAVTNQIFVVDWRGGSGDFRVHVFANPAAGTKGPAAVETLVGSEAGTINTSTQRWNRPYGLEFPPGSSNAFWLVDSKDDRMLYYTKQSGTWQAKKLLGQRNLAQIGGPLNCGNGSSPEIDCSTYHPAGSLGFDTGGNLYVTDLGEMRVLRFPASIPDAAVQANTGAAVAAKTVLFPRLTNAFGANLTTAKGMYAPNNAALIEYPTGSPARQLLVFDQHRALFWNDYTNKSSGAVADGVLYQSDFNSQSDLGQGILLGYAANASGSKIFVGTWRGIDVFQGPLTSGEAPIKTIPLDIPFRSGGSTGPVFITGLAYDEANDALWVSDSDAHRVFRIANPLSDARVVNLVLGQPNAGTRAPNRGKDFEHYPDGQAAPCPTMAPDSFGNMRGLRLDRQGNLYVVDAGHEGWQCSNNRMLEFDAATLVPHATQDFFCGALDAGCTNPRRAKRVYGPPDFVTKNPEEGPIGEVPNTPIGVTFDANNRMIMVTDGYGNPQGKRAFFYADPMPPCNTSAGCAVPATKAFPMAGAQLTDASFDSAGNLAVMDHTWTRILFYKGADLGPWMSLP